MVDGVDDVLRRATYWCGEHILATCRLR